MLGLSARPFATADRARADADPPGRDAAGAYALVVLRSAPMDAAAWTVIAVGAALLAAIGASFRSLRGEQRELARRVDAQGEDLRRRVDAQGEDLRRRVDAQGEDLCRRVDAQGRELGAQIGQLREDLGQLRERMAHLEGLLEGLREAIAGKRVA